MTTPAPVERPNPLKKAAQQVGTAVSAAAGVVSALVAFGALSVAQGDAITAVGETAPSVITAVGTVVAGVLPLIAGVVAAFGTASAARDEVTPVSDPRDNAGNPLTPDVVPVDSAAATRAALGDRGEGYARP